MSTQSLLWLCLPPLRHEDVAHPRLHRKQASVQRNLVRFCHGVFHQLDKTIFRDTDDVGLFYLSLLWACWASCSFLPLFPLLRPYTSEARCGQLVICKAAEASDWFGGLPRTSNSWTYTEGVPPSPSLVDDIPASEALERLLVCTCSTRSALSSCINDDFIGDRVVKKSQCLLAALIVRFAARSRDGLP